jgi:Fe-S-cluster-containing dehydrogenase component
MRVIFVSQRFGAQQADLAAGNPDAPVLMVDLDRCIACGACSLACRLEAPLGDGQLAPPRSILFHPAEGGGRLSLRLPLSCRFCPDPCAYHSPYNFWTTCPQDERRTALFQACDACAARLAQGWMPACATRCPMKCIYFGRAADVAFVLREKRLRSFGDLELGTREAP